MTAIASGLPLLAIRHPPFTDLPEHVAAIATLAKLLPGGGGAPYTLAFGPSQYFLYHFAGSILTRIVGDALLAHGLLLASVAVLWPLSLRSLLRALKRDERIAIFGCMLVYNRALLIGFMPFFASVPVALFGLSTLIRHLEVPSRRGALLLGTISFSLFYTHVSSSVLFAMIAVVMIGLRVAKAQRSMRLAIFAVVPLLPTAVAALMWLRAGSLEVRRGNVEHIRRLPIGTAISEMPIWTFEIWRSHVDELCAGVWWTSFAVILAIGLRREVTASGAFAIIPFVCTAIVYLITPHFLGFAGYLDVRLAPILVMFGLLGLTPQKGRGGDLPLVAAAAAALLMASNAAFEMARAEREHVGDLDSLLAHARPGTRLVMLNFESASRRIPFWPYVFAGSYHRANGGIIAGYSYTEMAHWPIHYKAEGAPPIHKPFWIYAPCAYRYRTDGEYYDYVLVQGHTNPFAEPTPGPTFGPIAHSRAFTLYAKTDAPSDDRTPDRGPCGTAPEKIAPDPTSRAF